MVSKNCELATFEIQSVKRDCPDDCVALPLCGVVSALDVVVGARRISDLLQGIVLLLLEKDTSSLYVLGICGHGKVPVCVG